MAILPTAHATQRYGSRAIDFYVAPGQVIGSDPRSRADERRIEDLDGERHPVRIGKRDFALDAGDFAAVIRLQPGPKRQSRPVAVVNYRTGTWTRTNQDNTSVLTRAGVSRNANWLLSVLAMAALSLLIVWPQLVALLGLLAPGLAAGLPAFDLFGALVSIQPSLADARLADAAPGLSETITALAPGLAGLEGVVIFAGLVSVGALIAFGGRSWRFAWVPVFLVLVLAGAVAINGPDAAVIPALLALGGTTAFFILAGIINRWRDAARLEARIARLADHVLRHPPQEMVTRRETPTTLSTDDVPAATPETVIDTATDTTGNAREDSPAAPVIAPVAAVPVSALAQEGEPAAQAGPELTQEASAAPQAEAITAVSDDGAIAAGSGESEAAYDARAETRAMDIPPPPPMPSSEAIESTEAPERVNRDAEAGEIDGATIAEPVVTETTTLLPDAPVETAGILPEGEAQADTAPDSASEAVASSEAADDQVDAGDAYGGAAADGDDPRPA